MFGDDRYKVSISSFSEDQGDIEANDTRTARSQYGGVNSVRRRDIDSPDNDDSLTRVQ